MTPNTIRNYNNNTRRSSLLANPAPAPVAATTPVVLAMPAQTPVVQAMPDQTVAGNVAVAGNVVQAMPIQQAVALPQGKQPFVAAAPVQQYYTPVVRPAALVPSNAVASWLSCLCCCWPCGLAAIFKDQEAQRLALTGDTDGAKKKLEESKSCVRWSVGLAVAFIILYFALAFALAAEGASSSSSSFRGSSSPRLTPSSNRYCNYSWNCDHGEYCSQLTNRCTQY